MLTTTPDHSVNVDNNSRSLGTDPQEPQIARYGPKHPELSNSLCRRRCSHTRTYGTGASDPSGSEQDAVVPKQKVTTEAVAAGDYVHQSFCEKCHEEGGRSTADDVGLLAGQWKLYLTYLFEDLESGKRQMPKKMADKLDAVREEHGEDGVQQLIEYYAGHNSPGSGQ